MKKISIILGFLIFILSGCDKFLDVNENPNYPTEVEDFLVLPAAQVSVASVFSADYGLIGSFWSQHWAQNNTSSQYKTFETYTLSSNAGTINRSYRELYYGGLSDNEIILKQALAEENWGVYLMSATLKAYMFQYLVDLYDNVPYSEAFLGTEGNLSPKIDNGKFVYESIYALLNEALSKDLSGFSAARYEKYDLLLGASMDDWIAFANTLKLRILLRQYDASENIVANTNTEISNLLANGTFLTKDVAFTNFEDADSKSNPFYESDQRQLNTKNNIRACATFVSYLKVNKDSRLQALFEVVNDEIIGMVPGSYEVPSTEFEAPDVVSKPKQSPTMPIYMMTVAETELLLAEAYLKTGDADQAEVHYEAGVAASFSRMGATIGDQLTEGYAFPATGEDAQLEAIIMQKWVDAAEGQRGIESFIERVRTGYPVETEIWDEIEEGFLNPVIIGEIGYVPGTFIYSKKGTTGTGNYPVRFPYPDAELNYNSSAAEYKKLVDADVMQTKVWWNK